MEIDESGPATHEARMEDYARRTAKAAETVVLLIEIGLFLGVLAVVVWLIAVFGN